MIGLREGRFSYRAIGAYMQRNRSTVMEWFWKQWTDEHRTTIKTSKGGRNVTQLAECWSIATGILMTALSNRLRLLHHGLRVRVPSHRIPLTTNHRWLLLQWAHEHRVWQADLLQVVFSDESRFNVMDHDDRIHVRREPNSSRSSATNLSVTKFSFQDPEPFFGDWKGRQKTRIKGRRRATTPIEDRYLVLTTRRHRNMNASLLQQHFHSATGTTVSTQTVRNRLLVVGLYARRQMVCVRLKSRHRRDRRECATVHMNWRRNEWSNVFFLTSPVFLFIRIIGVFSSGGTVAVGIILRSCTKVSDLEVGVVLVYGGISIDGRTYLYIIQGGPLTARQ
ncbi:transposable element Tcb2 transposase [Trichonephila clavipes]|nr:transposable element Tcb2 transposase [Trichonephila clavipes]